MARSLFNREHQVKARNTTVWVGERDGNGPAIVLLHGFPDDSTIYDRLIPQLTDNRVIAIDFAGYGLSSREPFRWTRGQREDEVVAVLTELDISKCILVGHDASVAVAINVTIDHPDLVAKLVLLNGYFIDSGELQLPDMIRLFGTPKLHLLSDALMAEPQQLQWLLGHSARQFGIDAATPGGVAAHSIVPQYFGSPEHPDSRAGIRAWTETLYPEMEANTARVAAHELSNLQTPVVVAFGEGDPFLTPAIASEIAGLFGSAVLAPIGNSSHWPQWDQPAKVVAAIQE